MRGSALLLRECARIFPHLRCLCVRRSACPVCLRVSVCAGTAVRGSVHVSRPCVTLCTRVGTVRTCSAQTTEGRGSGLCLGPGFPSDAVARLHPPVGTRGWVGRWRLSSHGYSEDRGILRCGPGHVYGEERTPGRGQIRCGRLSSPGPGKTEERNQLQGQGARRLGQSRGPKGVMGPGSFCAGS